MRAKFINEEKYYDLEYEYLDQNDPEYYETYGTYNGDNIFYHGAVCNVLNNKHIHLGTYEAAKQALEARIGVPAFGIWDGTRVYKNTLLKGKNNIDDLCYTGYNCGPDVPEENYLPTDRKELPKYADGSFINPDCKPIIIKVKIIGKMYPEIISDTIAR